MPPQTDLKARIQNALAQCAHGDLLPNALALFAALGYRSAKQISLPDNTARGFLAEFGDERFNAANALTDEWRSIDLVLQLTDTEINHTAQRSLFDSHGVDRSNYQSYLIFAIELAGATYARTALAKITREVNKLFAMPALILFKHGNTLTLSVIDRRLHKRDEAKDVLEKVTLIKDIRLANPHRAHIEILFDLALPTLLEQYHPQNFDALHDAWRAVLDTSELNKKFFRALANWFYWAQEHVSFPSGGGKNQAERNATALIRLITRLIFTWFIQEKDLVPPALFDEKQVRQLLADFAPARDTYYKAILQNLFFGTLNTEMHARAFRHEPKAGQRADDFMTHNRYRYKSYFANPDAWLALTRDIPFLNGGLFECLDKEVERNGKQELLRVDGFSDHPANELNVPNYLFFADENDPRYYKEKDNAHLNEVFGTKNKKYQVRGLVRLLHRYKFTIDENTPLEQEVALDPELLGKVFENLLAAYNPETGVTARKQTGSFYTPREIVNYMVDEALLAYLETRLQDLTGFQTPASHETAASIQRAREMSSNRDKNLSGLSLDARLRHLFAYTDEPHQFDAAETAALIEAIDNLKLLDPACGSGAFPMGALHKLVLILHKLDPDNARWKAKQIAKASEIPDTTVRERVVADIEQSFNRNELDYGRKLYLIENCIYGVDIQPIAVQIAKLRCFIALIVDEKMDAAKENRGIRPLPNLETKFVAANTLLGLDKPKQMLLRNPAIESKEKELADVRRSLFTARTRETKEKHRKRDAALRKEIGELLKKDGWLPGAANQLATWDPYDQNAHAEFFDAEWMFGVTDGFDVVIGNPPYGAEMADSAISRLDKKFAKYKSATKNSAIYFTYLSDELLTTNGINTFIVPKSICYSMGWNKCAGFVIEELTRLVDIGKAFENVKLEQVVFVRPKASRVKSFVNGLFEDNFIREFGAVSKSIFTTYKVLLAGQTEEEIKIIQLLLGRFKNTFGEFVSIERGLNWQSKVATHPGKTPVYRGAQLDKYVLNEATDFVSLGSFKRDEYAYQLKPKILNQLAIAHVQNPYPHFYLQAAFDEDGSKLVFETIACTFVQANNVNIRFVLGVNNSKLFAWLLYKFIYSNAIRSTRYDSEYVTRIPVPQLEQVSQQPIINLVDRILAAKRADADADTRAWEREIDELVYQLYGLTEDEIKIVEGRQESVP